MASLSIAKATLLASCLRRDNTMVPVSRNELAEFHTILEKTLSTCTPSNIQNTKAWLMQHIFPSSSRTTALSKYLTSLSKNIPSISQDHARCRVCRQQLHLLYLINDVLHHAKYHASDEAIRKNVKEHIPPLLSDVFANAAAENKSRTSRRLQDLINIWEKEQFWAKDILFGLRDVVVSGKRVEIKAGEPVDARTAAKELPWIMPATHGDPTAPYFDLPAANLMPHILPNSSRPMRPDQIRALHLTAGPADESLVNALKDFLNDVKSIHDPYAVLEDEGIVPDVDEMGQVSYKNEADDAVIDTYYGWSRAFCEKMKKRDRDNGGSGRSRSSSRSRSLTRSRSPSRSPIREKDYSSKRRRHSTSRSPSRSMSFNRDHSPQRFDSAPRRSSPHRAPNLQSFSSAPPPRFQPSQQFHHPPPQPPPPPPSAPFGMPPFQPPHLGSISPPRPPNWPHDAPWPPPPPPPPQNFHPHAYGRR
ncbi:hypothetical protein H2198_001900 [Neophaeococcomyces mojaviensis]|uniref:Uncharacterized protein n=1 Tax=Neophaeococcomyces mojaviensis TaxID=3383035 RepID=A0ACC3AG88_9EURO|nr:hypothetical protein H2198_001900 [Knufia sp. JES_112]